jgi:TRAP-type C4-dicarboxylate transport system permease small subunit
MPSSWGIMVTVLLILGGMSLLLLGSILYSSPLATQWQPLVGMSLLIAGGTCFLIFVILLLVKRDFLFPPLKKSS